MLFVYLIVSPLVWGLPLPDESHGRGEDIGVLDKRGQSEPERSAYYVREDGEDITGVLDRRDMDDVTDFEFTPNGVNGQFHVGPSIAHIDIGEDKKNVYIVLPKQGADLKREPLFEENEEKKEILENNRYFPHLSLKCYTISSHLPQSSNYIIFCQKPFTQIL